MIPADVKEIVERFTCEYAPHLREIVQLDMALAIAADRASRLTRQEDEIRKAALEDATASARFARLMGIASRIIWADLGEPAMQNAQTQVALQELSEFVLQDALEEAHRIRALSQKGDEADG